LVSVSEVREFLNDITAEDLPDASIERQIDVASAKVDAFKSDMAEATLVERAKLVVAGYLSYISYASRIERGIGVLPPAVREQLERYEALADQFLSYVQRGKVITKDETHPPLAMPVSLYEGELEKVKFEEE